MKGEGGAPGPTRTADHLVRSQVLYPTELRVHHETSRYPWGGSWSTKRAMDFLANFAGVDLASVARGRLLVVAALLMP